MFAPVRVLQVEAEKVASQNGGEATAMDEG